MTHVKKKKSDYRKVANGVVRIVASFNNTLICITDLVGNVLCWSSAGKMKFKGSQRGTSFAAQVATDEVAKTAVEKHGMKIVLVVINGPGAGRESAVRALQTSGLIVTSIVDITPVVHNGCRPPKRRRI